MLCVKQHLVHSCSMPAPYVYSSKSLSRSTFPATMWNPRNPMLYVASDLHFGMSSRGDSATAQLASFACSRAQSSDVLCIAGDIGTSPENFRKCLGLFQNFPGHKCAVAGNHDIWVPPGHDSRKRLDELERDFNSSGFHPLEQNPLLFPSFGIVGTIGWYDYSFHDPELGIPHAAYSSKCFPDSGGGMWGDATHVRWSWSDPEASTWFEAKLRAHLEQCRSLPQVIVVMHHLPTKKLLVHPRWVVPRVWRFFNAFLGSERYAKLLGNYPQVRMAFCGHIHLARKAKVNGQTYVSLGGDYQEKELVTYDGEKVTRTMFRAS